MENNHTGQDKQPKKKSKLVSVILYGIIAAVFITGVVKVLEAFTLPPNLHFFDTPAPAVTPTPIATAPAPDSTGTNAGLNATASPDLNATPVPVPVMIYFDAHKQKAVIEVVGIGEGNVMGSIDDPYKAGWFYYGASPGEAGNAIINGHQRFNKKKGIFSVLKNSKPGESVRIDFNEGFTRYFEIESIESYLAQDIPEEIIKVGKDTPTRLILITCLGDYDFTGQSMSRVVVICKEQTQLRQENDTRPIPGPVKE